MIEQLKRLHPGLDDALLERHLTHLPERYFECFDLESVARHLEGLGSLSPQQPVEVLIQFGSDGRVDCTFLAFDYAGEFSLFAGILAASGFEVESGDIFTYEREAPESAPPAQPPSSLPLTNHQRHLLRQRWLAFQRLPDRLRRRLVIDRFQGTIEPVDAPPVWAQELRERTLEIILKMENKEIEKARNRVNEMVTQRLESLQAQTPAVLYPIHLEIDNDGPYTRLKVVSEDTPAFLYSLSNALSLRDISIERVTIRTHERRIQDEIEFLSLSGQRITDAETLRQIKLSALFTKQFTYFLPSAPDPYAALTRFNNLLQDVTRLPEEGRWLERFSQTRNLDGLARVLGASDFIWEDFIRLQHEVLLPILEPGTQSGKFFDRSTLAARLEAALKEAASPEEWRQKLNEFKDHEIFLIDLDHILKAGSFDPRSLAENLNALAELIVRKAYSFAFDQLTRHYGVPRTVGGLEAHCAVLGLGKFGGVAMGYASDFELLFVYSDNGETDGPNRIKNAEFFERLVQSFRDTIKAKREGIFELDLQLRPYGNKGSLASSLEAFCRYFGPGGEAYAYERLALVRLRAVAGDPMLGAQIERLRDEFVYEAQTIEVRQIHDLRKKQLKEKTGERPNAKFSPGAMVDLEYAVQILQVTYAQIAPALKTPRIHEALEALLNAGLLSPLETGRLSNAYYFLRRLVNGLRMLRGNARDLFLPPADSEEFVHLAHRMGYERRGELDRSQQLYLDFETHTAAIRAFVERHFGRESLPGPLIGSVADLVLSDQAPPELIEKIFKAVGIQDGRQGMTNLQRLAGSGERRERFAMLAVLAFDMLRSKADPAMALNNWERFCDSLEDPKTHFETLLSQPRRLDILLSIFSNSQFLSDVLAINPGVFEWVTSPANLHRTLERAEVERELRERSRSLPEHEAWLDAIRIHRRREILRIGTRDICLGVPIRIITGEISALADGIVQATLERFWQTCAQPELSERFCILAFGKLGGCELNYSSDIDLIGVYDGPADPLFAKAMEEVREDLAKHTNEGYAYRVDLRLRPYGRSGQLVPSVSTMVNYYRDKASHWEVQALLKARPIAGNLRIGRELLERLRFAFKRQRSRQEVVRSIETLRSQAIAQTAQRQTLDANGRLGASHQLDVKNGRGGIRDIEFLVQGLQMIHAVEYEEALAANTIEALGLLAKHGILPVQVSRALHEYYVFMRRVEHFLQILDDRQTHSLPLDKVELSALSKRVLGGKVTEEIFRVCIEECLKRVWGIYQEYLLGKTENSD
ncbi:MAG: glutamate-ammonia-ligase adenylyltransferase [Candidatus Sumerlaeota bacterium]|nr:glutamate-ammonia-ligase adenylyltransferase [Candidatus Sumerlaeota bacterium]